MKIFHLSDLHLGKRVNEFSMIEDQKYILKEILGIIDERRPDGIVIAGDIYDKSTPSVEAVSLFDDFLVSLNKRNLQVYIISGNHDSADRLAFASRLIDITGIHISRVYSGSVTPLVFNDDFGPVNFWLLPFVKMQTVRTFFPEIEINTYTDALNAYVMQMNIDKSQRNVLVAHQFVTGAVRSESEEIIGGLDNVDASVFSSFDYTALGHIHRPQNIENERIRYCGSPLKYSFSEANHSKSVTEVVLGKKGDVTINLIPLVPEKDMKEIRGTYDEVMSKDFYENTTYRTDYMRVILTDENDIPDAVSRLRTVYRNIMKLDYDNARTRSNTGIQNIDRVEEKTPFELFSEHFEQINNHKMSDEQSQFISSLIEKVWEDNE